MEESDERGSQCTPLNCIMGGYLLRVYLDNCCYNRILDDRSYFQIYYEKNSVMLILELAEKMEIQLIGSQMLVREINDVYKRSVLHMIYSLCREEIFTKVMNPSEWLLEVLY